MGKSKYQKKAIEKKKIAAEKRPRYYDEIVSKKVENKNSGAFAIFTIVVIVIAGIVVGIGAYLNNQQQETQTTTTYVSQTTTQQTNTYGTPLTLTTITGERINLADYEGRVVVLYFFYLDCPACSYNTPELIKASANFTTNQLLIIAITVKPTADTNERLTAWETGYGIQWPIVKDYNYDLSSRYAVTATPTMVYLDPQGNYANKQIGAQDASVIAYAIQSLL